MSFIFAEPERILIYDKHLAIECWLQHILTKSHCVVLFLEIKFYSHSIANASSNNVALNVWRHHSRDMQVCVVVIERDNKPIVYLLRGSASVSNECRPIFRRKMEGVRKIEQGIKFKRERAWVRMLTDSEYHDIKFWVRSDHSQGEISIQFLTRCIYCCIFSIEN